nr:uncharacterized protein LOC118973827 isoform X3 [Manis javanica]
MACRPKEWPCQPKLTLEKQGVPKLPPQGRRAARRAHGSLPHHPGPTAPRGLHVAMRRQSSEGTGASPGGALGSPAALGMSWRDTEELECLSPSERSLPENNTSCRTPTLIFWKRRHWRQKRDCAVPGHPDGGDRDQRSGRGAWDPAVPAAGSCAPKPVAGLTARRLKARTVPPPQWGAVTHHRAMGSGSA